MPNEGSSDDATYRRYGESLRSAIAEALPQWLERQIELRIAPDTVSPAEAGDAIDRACAEALARIDELLDADIDRPISGPLELVRRSLGPVVDLLDRAAADEVARDPFDTDARPDDRYGLGPMSFLDLGAEVHEAGIAWGAAKAHLHLARRSRIDGSSSA